MTLTPCPECGHQVSAAAMTCPECGHPIREETTEPGERPFPGLNPLLVSLLSAAVIIVGSLMPWISVDSIFGPLRVVSGTEGDGVFALFAGVLMVAVAGVALARASASAMTGLLLVVLAGASGLAALNVFSDLADVVGLAGDTALSAVEAGLWLVLIGSAAGVGAGVALYGSRDTRSVRANGSLTGLWVGTGVGLVLLVALFVIGDQAVQNEAGDALRDDIADRLGDIASRLRDP